MKAFLISICAALFLTNTTSIIISFHKVQAMEAENANLQHQLKEQRQLNEELSKKASAAQERENATATVQDIAGIYVHSFGFSSRYDRVRLDLRTDGTAQFSPRYLERTIAKTWKNTSNLVSVVGVDDFHIEGTDIIDSKGNRWERVR